MTARRVAAVFGVLVVLLLLGIATPSLVSAADKPGGKRKGGITISPALQEIIIESEKPRTSFDLSLTNNSSNAYELALSVVDFGSLDESGGVLFVGQAEKTLNYRFGLTPWVSLERDRLVIEPGATEKVPVSILNRESMTPGGHYGAVLVTPTEVGGDGDKVQINQVASSLIFAKKVGGELYSLSLRGYDVPTNLFSTPTQAELRFQNSGNVHVIPRGTVAIYDPAGREVKRGIINEQSAIVLPDSSRQLNVQLSTVLRSWLPGRYKVVIEYRYDGQQATQTKTLHFFYLNVLHALLVGLVLASAVTLLVSRKLRSTVRNNLKRALQNIRQSLHRLFRASKLRLRK